MPFPEVRRVIFRKNPLDKVICQLRFPPILRIDSEIPSDFQDKVRKDFPNYSEVLEEVMVEIQSGKGSVPPDSLKQLIQSSQNKNYEFSSEDGFWKINLTRTFLALTSSKYERWEQFKERLQLPLQTLIDTYAPAYFSRVGLRYIDVIKRSNLGLEATDWNELLKPPILGVLASPDIGKQVRAFENKHDVGLSDQESAVRIITRFVESANTGELCYMIDNDFSNSNKTPIDAVLEKLDFLNSRGSRLFQWCITEKLHNAMEPQLL